MKLRAVAAFLTLALLPPASCGAADAVAYRVTFLTRSNGFAIVSGGDALRIAPDCRCADLPPGTPAIVTLDEDGRVAVLRRASSTDIASDKIPPGAIVVDPRSSRALANAQAAVQDVTVTLLVTVPADTPPGDDLYVSTSRSGWSAAELRMERVDPLHWQLAIRVPAGLTLLYRYSRGTFATLEADRSGQLLPARKLVAKDGLTERDSILRFADSN